MQLKDNEFIEFASANRFLIVTNHRIMFNNQTWGEKNQIVFERRDLVGVRKRWIQSHYFMGLVLLVFVLGSILNVTYENAVYAILAFLLDIVGVILFLWQRNRDVEFVFKDHIVLMGRNVLEGFTVEELRKNLKLEDQA